ARELGYSRLMQWIRKDNDFSIKANYWDQAGRELKHLNILELEQISDIWSAKMIEMVNIQSNHHTRLEFAKKIYNTTMKDRMFTQRTLKRGYR
ncbi:MAG: outer membrane lipoprotein-sorting protein, partial [Mariprofundaceae bacterium]|nr:outer membrane lipoprotein-sorting protein [Mariprofundaceae bacterium]